MFETSWNLWLSVWESNSSSSFSTNITSLFAGHFKYRGNESTLFDVPNINLTLRTNLSLPLFVAMVYCHLPSISFCLLFQKQDVTNLTIALWWIPLLLALKCHQHFFSPSIPKFIWNVLYPPPVLTRVNIRCWKYSWRWYHDFRFRCQLVYWTQRDDAVDIMSKSVVNGRESRIASTPTSSVRKDSSLRRAPWVFGGIPKSFLAVLIFLSHTPPILLAAGGFFFQDIY